MSDIGALSDADLLRLLEQQVKSPKGRQPDALDNPNMATEGMSGLDKFGAGMGKAFSDLGRGALQLIPGQGPTGEQVAEQRKLDAPLMKTGAGMAGNIAGNLVPALATAAIPVANTYTGAAATGAMLGLLSPSENTSEKLLNAGTGGAAGLGGQAAANLIGRIVRPVQSSLNPEAQRLAGVLQGEGVPLDAAQATGSKPLQTVNAVLENLPFSAGPEAAKKTNQAAAYTRAILNRTGIAGDSASPAVLAAQKQSLGKGFEDIAGRNVIDMNPVVGDLSNVVSEASRRLTPDQAGAISRTVDDILGQVQPNGTLLGTNYQGWRSELGRLSRGNDSQAHYFGQVKRVLDNAFNSQVSGADAQAWKELSTQYGNLKTVMRAMGGQGANPASGTISPNQLSQALTASVGREGRSVGRGDMNDLVRAGQVFIRDQVGNPGTAQRLFYQNLLTGGAGAALGAGGGAFAGQTKPSDIAENAAIGVGALMTPRLVQALLNSPAAASYLTRGATNPSAVALARALQAGALPASLAIANSQQ